jgi:hypothetical protein
LHYVQVRGSNSGEEKERMWPWTSHRFCQNLYCLQHS